MNLKQLRQFVVLAETGNFHKAAGQMHMAQPPLSVSIRKLEEEMGSPLFERTPKGVFLTVAGQAMLADARQVIFHAQQCQQAVTAALHGEGGLLRVGFIGTATYFLLPRLIPSFRQHYPKIDLELTESTSSSTLEGLMTRRLDVGLVRYPLLDSGPFELTTLDEDEFVVAVSASSKLARRTKIALSVLADEPFIMYAQSTVPGLFAVAMLRCQQSGFRPRVTQEAMQVQTILSLVESGLGVALVAGVAKRYITRGVKFLTLTDNPPDFRIGIALITLKQNQNRLIDSFSSHARMIASQLQTAVH